MGIGIWDLEEEGREHTLRILAGGGAADAASEDVLSDGGAGYEGEGGG